MYKALLPLALLSSILLSIPVQALQSYSDGASETITLPGNEYLLGKFYRCDNSCPNYPQGVTTSQITEYYHFNSYYNYYWVLIEPSGNETVLAEYKVIKRDGSRDVVSPIAGAEYYVYRFLDMPPTNVTFNKNGDYKIELRKIYLNRPTLEHNTGITLISRIDLWALQGGWWPDPSKRDPNSNYLTFGCCGYEGMIREYVSQRNVSVSSLAETLDVYEIEIKSIEEPAEPVENPFSLERGGGQEEGSNSNVPLAVAGIAGIALISTVALASGSIIRHWRTPAGKQAESDRKRAYLRMEEEKIAYENWQRGNENRKAAEGRAARETRVQAFQEDFSKLPMGTQAERGSSYYTLAQKYPDVLGEEGKQKLLETSDAEWKTVNAAFSSFDKIKPAASNISYSQSPAPIFQSPKEKPQQTSLLSAAGNTVSGIVEGIKGAFSWLLGGAKQVAGAVKGAVESVPVVGKPIADFAHGFGKSIYNSAKFFLWDMPKGAFDWVTTSKDHLGDIKTGVKFVADGISWVVAHPLEAAGTVKNLAQQAWSYCTGSAFGAGECTGEIAQMIIPTGAAVSVAKSGKQALSLGKYKKVAEELTEGYFRNPKNLNPSAYTEKVRTRFGERLRLDGAESILKERGALAQTNIKTGKVAVANDPFALKNTKQLVLHEVLHSQTDIPKELEKLAINGGRGGFEREYNRLLATYINQKLPGAKVSAEHTQALRESGKLDFLIKNFDKNHGNLIEDMLVDKLALKADKKGYFKFLKENLADNLLRWGEMSEFGKAQAYFFAKSLLKDRGMAKKLEKLIGIEGKENSRFIFELAGGFERVGKLADPAIFSITNSIAGSIKGGVKSAAGNLSRAVTKAVGGALGVAYDSKSPFSKLTAKIAGNIPNKGFSSMSTKAALYKVYTKKDGGKALYRYLANKRNMKNIIDKIDIDPKIGTKIPDISTPFEVIEHTKISKPASYTDIYRRIGAEAEQLSYVKGKTRTVLVEISKDSKISADDIKHLANDLSDPEQMYMILQGKNGKINIIDKIVIAQESGSIVEISTELSGLIRAGRIQILEGK